MDIQWESPDNASPGSVLGVRHREMRKIAEELKLHPGEWALLQVHETPRKARSQASNINTGNIRALDGCRAMARMGKVYVQWPKESPADPLGLVTHSELRDFIDRLGMGFGPGELAEALRMSYDIFPRGYKS